MNRVIVLVMHGAPPRDFPRQEAGEFFSLGSRLRQPAGPERAALAQRHAELEAKMRAWPRTAQNDPFHAASVEIADELARASGAKVVLGFGEFCAPTMDEALDLAAESSPDQVVVITPMVTRGGEHSESEIPAAVRRAGERHLGVAFEYVWPYPAEEVARFLASQIDRFLPPAR